MPKPFSRTVATATFLTLFNLAATAGPAEDIEAALDSAPLKAVPRFYYGKSSPDFSHLQKKNIETRKAPATSSTQMTHISGAAPSPDFNIYKFPPEYAQQLKKLAEICPSLKAADPQNFNTVAWLQKHVALSDTSDLRRDFIEALYFTIGHQTTTVEKIEAITDINKILPDSPAFVEFMQKKRQELAIKIKADKFLTTISSKDHWKNLNDSNQELALNHVSRMTLSVLLPNKNIDLPQVFILKNILSKNLDGLYLREFNEIYLNGDRAYIRENFQSAIETVIHESFHAFHDILSRWYSQNLLTGNPELNRQARLYNTNSLLGQTAISSHENYQGYRNGLTERSAWAFQLAVSKEKSDHISKDLYATISNPVIYRADKEEGRLPAACLQ